MELFTLDTSQKLKTEIDLCENLLQIIVAREIKDKPKIGSKRKNIEKDLEPNPID
jgi:hypothetical protein